ncbi:hypothetical protein F383_33281 [Gossypium arboreum]|uniref:Uncharacterized protein n=1 Tax=Gossypium arboreum TaxID=29729 RepID=A0A0B0N3T8_GOSAR|nr:hypothetical protein F383_33281 [Gossypium arboreum]
MEDTRFGLPEVAVEQVKSCKSCLPEVAVELIKDIKSCLSKVTEEKTTNLISLKR